MPKVPEDDIVTIRQVGVHSTLSGYPNGDLLLWTSVGLGFPEACKDKKNVFGDRIPLWRCIGNSDFFPPLATEVNDAR